MSILPDVFAPLHATSRRFVRSFEAGSPVTLDYPSKDRYEFSGQVNWVEFDPGDSTDDQNHLMSAEERLKVAMAKQ
jgi:arylsulfatase